MKQMEMLNCVIEYRGGGYDGCFWEYNYCYITKQGKFEDIFSSGYAGIKDFKALLERIEDKPNDVTFYSLDSEADIKDFQADCAIDNVIGVIAWLNEKHPKHPMYIICSECGEKVTVASSTEFKGVGGLMTNGTNVLCEDCYCNGLCEECGEYSNEPLKEVDGNMLCEYCASE